MKMDILLVQCRPKHELNDFRYQSENLALGLLGGIFTGSAV
ncbi:hypothetical protein SAMN05444955_104166 [Lihuaxuella thermophila]|uniref:Uncharacterized protein n=1 Tax=Lihuaxuella thermophila TaxID=1173111 RepID=A0A1H8CXG3_9BACL|nr:hypothetical protein SAMN05444955_104166 [Lihuaxuella thermophila]